MRYSLSPSEEAEPDIGLGPKGRLDVPAMPGEEVGDGGLTGRGGSSGRASSILRVSPSRRDASENPPGDTCCETGEGVMLDEASFPSGDLTLGGRGFLGIRFMLRELSWLDLGDD